MPKRRNPFGDGSPLQLKTHVGKKELNHGVSGEQNLKAVYGNLLDIFIVYTWPGFSVVSARLNLASVRIFSLDESH